VRKRRTANLLSSYIYRQAYFHVTRLPAFPKLVFACLILWATLYACAQETYCKPALQLHIPTSLLSRNEAACRYKTTTMKTNHYAYVLTVSSQSSRQCSHASNHLAPFTHVSKRCDAKSPSTPIQSTEMPLCDQTASPSCITSVSLKLFLPCKLYCKVALKFHSIDRHATM